MSRSKHSEGIADELIASGTRRRKDASEKIKQDPKKDSPKKIPNKIITLNRRKGMHYAGLDLHKRTIQIAVVDKHGNKLLNKNISSSLDVLKKELARMPRDTQYVIESSSVWEGVYNCMAHDLGLDVILSNPYKTRLIAESKKKTDKVDAFILADMLRGGYIASCYVPDFETIDNRKLARYRGTLVRNRTGLKNSIHGILLQLGFKGRGTPFSPGWLMRVRGINDYRIHGYLRNIDAVNGLIAQADVRIADAVKASPNAMLLKTIPGVGNYSALIISSEIGDIARFHRPEKLSAYAGIVPSVRNSAEIVQHGRITRRGSRSLRWILTECVHSHVRYARDSYITDCYNRIAKKRGKGKATMAAASKMLRVMHIVLTEKKEYVPHSG